MLIFIVGKNKDKLYGFVNCSTGGAGVYADGPSAWFTFDAAQGSDSAHRTEVSSPEIVVGRECRYCCCNPSTRSYA